MRLREAPKIRPARGPCTAARCVWRVGALAAPLVLAVTWMGGCEAPPAAAQPGDRLTPEQVVKMPLEKNITGVAAFYAPYNPWIWNENRSRIIGIAINALYLTGPDSMGAFGDGIIRPRIYILEAGPESAVKTPRLVKEWAFDPQEALPWRARKRTALGWGYGYFRLIWGDTLDLVGKEIRIIVSFERSDGKIFHSGQKDFRVPLTGQ